MKPHRSLALSDANLIEQLRVRARTLNRRATVMTLAATLLALAFP